MNKRRSRRTTSTMRRLAAGTNYWAAVVAVTAVVLAICIAVYAASAGARSTDMAIEGPPGEVLLGEAVAVGVFVWGVGMALVMRGVSRLLVAAAASEEGAGAAEAD